MSGGEIEGIRATHPSAIVRMAQSGPALLDGIAAACGIIHMLGTKLTDAGVELSREERDQMDRGERTIDAAIAYAEKVARS